MLTNEEEEELGVLRQLQKKTNRYLSQEEFERIKYLQSKQYDHHCMNPKCKGGHFPGEYSCQDCGRLLYIHNP